MDQILYIGDSAFTETGLNGTVLDMSIKYVHLKKMSKMRAAVTKLHEHINSDIKVVILNTIFYNILEEMQKKTKSKVDKLYTLSNLVNTDKMLKEKYPLVHIKWICNFAPDKDISPENSIGGKSFKSIKSICEGNIHATKMRQYVAFLNWIQKFCTENDVSCLVLKPLDKKASLGAQINPILEEMEGKGEFRIAIYVQLMTCFFYIALILWW